jgi:hypothetical protein
VPLYEAKMIHQFDHRYATYDNQESREATPEERLDPQFEPTPRYWVPQIEVTDRLASKSWSRGWLLGWRRIAPTTNERTLLVTALPKTGVGDSLFLMCPAQESKKVAALYANLNSLVCDYLVRVKVGGLNLSFFLVDRI